VQQHPADAELLNTNIKNYEWMVKLFDPAPSGRPHSTPQTDVIRRAVIAERKSAASSKAKNKSSSKGKNKAPSKLVEEEKDSDDDFMLRSLARSNAMFAARRALSKPIKEEQDSDDDFTPRSLARSNAMFAAWRTSSKPVKEEKDSDDDFMPRSNARHPRLKAQVKGKSTAPSKGKHLFD
jgi:hypothetical protein